MVGSSPSRVGRPRWHRAARHTRHAWWPDRPGPTPASTLVTGTVLRRSTGLASGASSRLPSDRHRSRHPGREHARPRRGLEGPFAGPAAGRRSARLRLVRLRHDQEIACLRVPGGRHARTSVMSRGRFVLRDLRPVDRMTALARHDRGVGTGWTTLRRGPGGWRRSGPLPDGTRATTAARPRKVVATSVSTTYTSMSIARGTGRHVSWRPSRHVRTAARRRPCASARRLPERPRWATLNAPRWCRNTRCDRHDTVQGRLQPVVNRGSPRRSRSTSMPRPGPSGTGPRPSRDRGW